MWNWASMHQNLHLRAPKQKRVGGRSKKTHELKLEGAH